MAGRRAREGEWNLAPSAEVVRAQRAERARDAASSAGMRVRVVSSKAAD